MAGAEAGLALEVEGLTKRFGAFEAVADVNLSVEPGCVYGFLGPNGAGKTTTIRMALGLMSPSSGSARIFGHDVQREFKVAIRSVGALVEGPAFYPFLSGRRNLSLFAGVAGGVPDGRIDAVLEQVGLARRGDDRVAGYSQGMRQRLGIAQALLGAPRLLVLDEPTNGLDPQGTREIRALIRGIRDRGETTVFLSSHLLAEMEQICDRVAVLAGGRVLREDSLDGLLASEPTVIRLEVAEPDDANAWAWLSEHAPGARRIRLGHFELDAAAHGRAALNRSLVGAGIAVEGLAQRQPSLEEVFVALTGEGGQLR